MKGMAVRAMAISAAQVNRRRPASSSDCGAAASAAPRSSSGCSGSIESPTLPRGEAT